MDIADDLLERLRAHGSELCAEALTAIEQLQAQLVVLEAELAVTQGQLRSAAREAEQPFRVTELPPNTPR